MSDDEARDDVLELLAGRLVREAGVTQEEARELIKSVGTDWESLLREAHFQKPGGDDK